MWRKGNPSALLVGMQNGAAVVKNIMEFSQNMIFAFKSAFINVFFFFVIIDDQ